MFLDIPNWAVIVVAIVSWIVMLEIAPEKIKGYTVYVLVVLFFWILTKL